MAVSSVWYKESSVSVTQGETTVVGTGTLWLTQARQGDLFAVMDSGAASRLYEIDSITDNTHLELVNPYADATVTGADYCIIRNFNTTTIGSVASLVVTHIDEIKKAFQNNLKGDQGDPGSNGYSVLSSNGAPSVSLGVDNDWCIDYEAEKWDMYRKEGGAWILRGTLKGETGDPGAAGALWYTGTTAPLASVGSVGDHYLHGITGVVYIRQTGGWVDTGISLRGPKGNEGDPGLPGDKGDPGDTGEAGSRWYVVYGVPSTSLGKNNDMATNNDSESAGYGDWYQKTDGVWSKKGNILGPRGIRGLQGDPGINWKGVWDIATEYVERDGIYYNGSSYVAAQDNVGQTPPDATTGGDTNWQVIARKGMDGTGSGDMLKLDYDTDGDGKVDAADLADQATYAVSAGRATAADSADLVNWNNIEARPTQYPPESHGLGSHTGATLDELNALISDADVPSDAVATTEAKGLMSAEDKTKLDGVGAGGSSVMLTLVHTTIPSSTTATTYEVLATGQIIGRSDWYMPELSVLLRRSGAGQVRLSLFDGTVTVTAETAAFTASGTDELTLDTTTLADGVAWDLTVEALVTTGTVTVDRLKIMADPVNEFSPPLVGSNVGNSTNLTTWTELGTSTFLPTWLDVDGRGGVILLADVDLGTAAGAEIRITIGTESVTQAVAFSGVVEIHCPFPSMPSAVMTATIEGKVTGGSGTIALSHWQLHIEK